MKHTLLFVDDEENILRALRRLFHRTGHHILLARSGAEALEVLDANPVSLIVSDQRMPGMSGAELLKAAREVQPDAVRVMLTGHSDLQAAVQAINEGGIFRFLAKPWDDDALLAVAAEALAYVDLKREREELQRQVRCQNEELRELNASLDEKVRLRTGELSQALSRSEELNESLRQQNVATVKAFANLLDLRSPEVGGHCRRVAGLVRPVCRRLGEADPRTVQEVIIAALLHDIGKVALSDTLLAKDPSRLSFQESREVRNHPVVGEGQVQVVEGLGRIARIIRHHHENADGSGYPDGLAGDQIPLGARLIRVLDTFDHLTRGGLRKGAQERLALEAMDQQVSRALDPRIFTALCEAIRAEEHAYDPSREQKVPLTRLAVGMVLSQDLKTETGVLLVPRDETLKPSYLEKIKNFSQIYPIAPHAFVYRQ